MLTSWDLRIPIILFPFLKKSRKRLLPATGTSVFDFQSDLCEFLSAVLLLSYHLCGIVTHYSISKMSHATNTGNEKLKYEALLNELLKRSAESIVLLNADAAILFCSESIQSSTGYEIGELIGRSAFDFFYDTNVEPVKKNYQSIVDRKEAAFTSLIQVRNKQGSMNWMLVKLKNMLHAEGIRAVFVLLKNNCDSGMEERKLVHALMDAREQEREFLASELHDNVNQLITATKLLVDSARTSMDKEELLSLSSFNLQFAADEIRKLSYSMVSYDLKEYGLRYAVNAFLTMLGKACTISFELVLDESLLVVLSAVQQLQVYRIIQEGINNIVRHAGASYAGIHLSRREDRISLILSDNGKGFSINGLKRGMGLYSISNRVKLLKGQLNLKSQAGEGTTIEIHFPM